MPIAEGAEGSEPALRIEVELVPGTGIEPARYQVPADFESAASASSAIPALHGSA